MTIQTDRSHQASTNNGDLYEKRKIIYFPVRQLPIGERILKTCHYYRHSKRHEFNSTLLNSITLESMLCWLANLYTSHFTPSLLITTHRYYNFPSGEPSACSPSYDKKKYWIHNSDLSYNSRDWFTLHISLTVHRKRQKILNIFS